MSAVKAVPNNPTHCALCFFSLKLGPIIKKTQELSPNLQKHSWYLDNGVLADLEDDLIIS